MLHVPPPLFFSGLVRIANVFFPHNLCLDVLSVAPNCLWNRQAMAEVGMPLLIHGEVTTPEVDIFDKEARFIEEVIKVSELIFHVYSYCA